MTKILITLAIILCIVFSAYSAPRKAIQFFNQEINEDDHFIITYSDADSYFGKIKNWTKSSFGAAKSYYDKARKNVGEALSNAGSAIRNKLIAAENKLREAEEKLWSVSEQADNKIDKYIEKIEERLHNRTNDYRRVLKPIEKKIANDENCQKEFSQNVIDIYNNSEKTLKICLNKEIQLVENVAYGVKRYVVDLPKKIVRLSANIMTCMNSPGIACVDPIQDILEITGQVIYHYIELQNILEARSVELPVEIATCLGQANMEFEIAVIGLRRQLHNKCKGKINT